MRPEPPTCIKCGAPLWHLVFVVDHGVMDGTRLNTAADKINELADQVDTFTDTASEKAADVANQMRSTAEDLKTMASSLEEGGGTEGGTMPTA